MELIWLDSRVGILSDRTNLGLIRFSKDVVLVDSGIDESYARKALKIFSLNDLNLRWLVNTHFHADHIGGNAFIKKRTNVQVITHVLTKPFVENPILEPLTLSCGAYPTDELRSKFFLAEPSKVDETFEGDGYLYDLQIIELPGHALGQVGVAVGDIIFAADSIFGEEILRKKTIAVYNDIDAAIRSLDKLKSFNCCVPSHGSINGTEIISLNKAHIEFVAEKIRLLMKEPKSEENIICDVLQNLQVDVADVGMYYLLRMTILAYLNWLKKTGEAQLYVDKGRTIWQRL
ncbi:MAG TPA: MBL fold metallo-hydrolase [Pseudothermotoga sp.]|nr:MBL fold metallo-hydrolase [Pseudothermotoga sp.]HOK82636.1 MBL fold metallo-hydrolase [Pseudothermotoga sp.]HPP70397.1 MBL fold metallo-hydrolase [Pseudothermotoga sp.]